MGDVDEYAVVDSETGALTGTPINLSNFTLRYNVSLSCFTEAVRGTRPWQDLEQCFELVFSIFSLKRVRIVGWPLRGVFPWCEAFAQIKQDRTASTGTLFAQGERYCDLG